MISCYLGLLCWPVIVKMTVKMLVAQSCPLLHPIDCSPQAPLSMEFSRQEYWTGEPFLSPGGLPDSGIEPSFPTLQADSLQSGLSKCWDQFVIFIKNNIYSWVPLAFSLWWGLSHGQNESVQNIFFNFNNFLIIKTNIKDSQFVQF